MPERIGSTFNQEGATEGEISEDRDQGEGRKRSNGALGPPVSRDEGRRIRQNRLGIRTNSGIQAPNLYRLRLVDDGIKKTRFIIRVLLFF